jgi:uroporphyrin-III C-methyltransferase/precorrin-2 dehydrogenase/sirohydrochlorin ferrochelatase
MNARLPPPSRPGGFVWLVGAGPGDPELVTRKAARVLAAADVVFYDGLVPLEVLALAPAAQRFSVAKRAGDAGAASGGMAQETIHRLLVRAARRGKRVVRLKGGDPFVLGRGGEEALALAAAGVPFEVVPGVSSAVAAPALAGIPVTHRGLASAFVVVAGHSPRAYAPVLDGLRPNAATVVVLMGLAARGELTAFLLARGWEAGTPAAMLLAAGTPEAYTWTGPLAELAAAEVPARLGPAPGTLVVGEVVALASVISGGGHRIASMQARDAAPSSRGRAAAVAISELELASSLRSCGESRITPTREKTGLVGHPSLPQPLSPLAGERGAQSGLSSVGVARRAVTHSP